MRAWIDLAPARGGPTLGSLVPVLCRIPLGGTASDPHEYQASLVIGLGLGLMREL